MNGCSVEGCTRKHEARGLCKVHYNQAVREKKIELYEKRGRPRIYTDEERKEIALKKAKESYYKRKGYEKGEKPVKDRKNNHPSYTMYSNAKKRAKDKKLPFDLDLEDIEIPLVCPLLGIEIKKGDGWYTDNSPTLDRKIPELGYVKGNVWVVSMRANRLKQDASVEEIEVLLTNLKKELS
jgi:hypothetical protein